MLPISVRCGKWRVIRLASRAAQQQKFGFPQLPSSNQKFSLGLGQTESQELIAVNAQIYPREGQESPFLLVTAIVAQGYHIYTIDQEGGGPQPTRLDETSAAVHNANGCCG